MHIKLFAVALLLLPCLPGTASAQAQLLSTQGYGKVRFGDNIAVAQARMRQRAKPAKREAACDYVSFSKYPGIKFILN